MNIQPAYVTFEQAKWLKEKGFDIPTTHYYFEDGEFKEHSLIGTNGYYGEPYEFNLEEFYENWNDNWLTKKNGDRCFGCSKERGYFKTYSAPEQWQVVEWLRIEKSIWIYVIRSGNQFYPIYQDKSGDKHEIMEFYYTPQEAYSAAFDYILTNLI